MIAKRKLNYKGKIFILILIILASLYLFYVIDNFTKIDNFTNPEHYDNSQDIPVIVIWDDDVPMQDNITININECEFDYINNTKLVCVIRR